jgi:hypothetical protein
VKDESDAIERTKVTSTHAKGLEVFTREIWSAMEAAVEKKTPLQYLSERAIRVIQGKR